MTSGYISIGSNIDKEIHIPAGLKALQSQFGKLLISSIYESEAVGFAGANFHNLVIGFESDLPILTIAKLLRQIELENGRAHAAPKFSSRTLDLDLLLYGEHVVNEHGLHIPRPEIERYAFVLEPLAEIAPEVAHPVSGKHFGEIWRQFDKQGLTQRKVYTDWLSVL